MKRLIRFIDKLPIPPTLKPKQRAKNDIYYEVRMLPFKHSFHASLKPSLVWGYEAQYPGPTIEVKKGEHVKVKWINALPSKHLLPVDKTVHGAEPDSPEVRTVVHLHGGHVPPESDGYPDAWFTRDFKETGPFFTQKIYDYPNQQRAATLLYHDHAVGITRLNFYAGLVGFYLIHDDEERDLTLPKGKYDIPLLIQDKSFLEDGSLFYPRKSEDPAVTVDPSVVPEFFGDFMIVNGKAYPFLDVEPRKYRFRIANGANARYFRIRLDSGQPFFHIGTDGGLFERPVQVEEILLGPAQRADVILDFSGLRGKKIVLTNDAPTPFPEGDPVNVETAGQIMQFRVSLPLSDVDKSSITAELSQIQYLSETQATKIRDLPLVETKDEYGRLLLLLDHKRWNDPISERPHLGGIEVWRLINETEDTHPIHLHLVHFQILDRQPFDEEHFEEKGEILFTGDRKPPEPNERGWKDIVNAHPGEVTRIIARFKPYTGRYVWHCHILEHEDHEMMRPYEVQKSKMWSSLLARIERLFK
ncbi:spore coat protein A [Thalassobacillus cyri]|uniref:Spore coat protein A n=1 Tax=Thalassobacillus cyri TaxID=571932 RepID=A0A1H4F065_9BACI|nr:multicopper oxidase [Thalassobacillus cyri]SEA90694.1 spore coat protein A [Thalassobacillus cyri]